MNIESNERVAFIDEGKIASFLEAGRLAEKARALEVVC